MAHPSVRPGNTVQITLAQDTDRSYQIAYPAVAHLPDPRAPQEESSAMPTDGEHRSYQIVYPAVAEFPNPRTPQGVAASPTDDGHPFSIDGFVHRCSRTPQPFCRAHASARISASTYPVALGTTIIVYSRHRRVLPKPYHGTVSSVVHVSSDAYMLHVVETPAENVQPACILLSVSPGDAKLGILTQLRQRITSNSLMETFDILPSTVYVYPLAMFPHKSQSRFLALRRLHASASTIALRYISRIPGLRGIFGLPISLSTPILLPIASSLSLPHDLPELTLDLVPSETSTLQSLS